MYSVTAAKLQIQARYKEKEGPWKLNTKIKDVEICSDEDFETTFGSISLLKLVPDMF